MWIVWRQLETKAKVLHLKIKSSTRLWLLVLLVSSQSPLLVFQTFLRRVFPSAVPSITSADPPLSCVSVLWLVSLASSLGYCCLTNMGANSLPVITCWTCVVNIFENKPGTAYVSGVVTIENTEASVPQGPEQVVERRGNIFMDPFKHHRSVSCWSGPSECYFQLDTFQKSFLLKLVSGSNAAVLLLFLLFTSMNSFPPGWTLVIHGYLDFQIGPLKADQLIQNAAARVLTGNRKMHVCLASSLLSSSIPFSVFDVIISTFLL